MLSLLCVIPAMLFLGITACPLTWQVNGESVPWRLRVCWEMKEQPAHQIPAYLVGGVEGQFSCAQSVQSVGSVRLKLRCKLDDSIPRQAATLGLVFFPVLARIGLLGLCFFEQP